MKTKSNKKVILHERKRHTARRVASTRYADLYPHPVSMGEYPGVLHPPSARWGTPPVEVWTDKLKTVPSPILRMRAVKK